MLYYTSAGSNNYNYNKILNYITRSFDVIYEVTIISLYYIIFNNILMYYIRLRSKINLTIIYHYENLYGKYANKHNIKLSPVCPKRDCGLYKM